MNANRGAIFEALRKEGIGVNVHYPPVHLHPFYRKRFGTRPGLCPAAEAAYERILSLPLFPSMEDREVKAGREGRSKGRGGMTSMRVVAIIQARDWKHPASRESAERHRRGNNAGPGGLAHPARHPP